MKAIWKNTVLADSDDTVNIEGNHYFPPSSLNMDYFTESETQSVCPWKGTANYYSLKVKGNENEDAAWYYPEVSELASSIKGRIAFWKGVEVVE